MLVTILDALCVREIRHVKFRPSSSLQFRVALALFFVLIELVHYELGSDLDWSVLDTSRFYFVSCMPLPNRCQLLSLKVQVQIIWFWVPIRDVKDYQRRSWMFFLAQFISLENNRLHSLINIEFFIQIGKQSRQSKGQHTNYRNTKPCFSSDIV